MKSVMKSKKVRKALAVVVVAVAAVAVFAAYRTGQAGEKRYATTRVETGTIESTVTATGTVQPVTTVLVGSQISGTIAWIGVDFNSPVKRGQVIARLDPANVQTQIENAQASVASATASGLITAGDIETQKAAVAAARANVEAARAQRDDARANADRLAALANVVSARDIEAARSGAAEAEARYQQAVAQLRQAEAAANTAEIRRTQAQATLAQANAQLKQASVNLDHTVITSPIDGVVVSRDVDVGQTVAASLQAPTLFTIANDLSKMQVLASIDEADVGRVREGLGVRATVDTFPDETFIGRISQVRLNAKADQNVVTYTAVVDVDNPDMKLRPGMTANVTVAVERRENVLTVPNAALRFKPELTEEEQQQMRERGRQARGGGESPAGRQTVWVLTEAKQLEPRRVQTGLSDGRVTEIAAGDLREGEQVVTGAAADSTARPAQQQQSGSPFGGRGVGGGRGRGR
jgi:HlyD family secretion protein